MDKRHVLQMDEPYVLREANLNIKELKRRNIGKVRDTYISSDLYFLCLIATDRLSAFDCILPQSIPCKGQVLNQLSAYWFAQTKHIVPNWLLETPHPRVSVGEKCKPFGVEFIVRGYLAGHAARCYEAGKRMLCGEALPEGLKRYERLSTPILTPTTKASKDEDISGEEIIRQGYMTETQYEKARDYAFALYEFGHRHVKARGLILVDAKYEFGMTQDGRLILIDELHTPDSARYFYQDDYRASMDAGRAPLQFSKEFIRQWLIQRGVNGTEAQLSPDSVQELARRYRAVYAQITGESFVPVPVQQAELEACIRKCLSKYQVPDKAAAQTNGR